MRTYKIIYRHVTQNMMAAKHSTIDIGSRTYPDIPTDDEKGFPLFYVDEQYYSMNDLVLDDTIKERLERIIFENKNYAKLLSYDLKPKQKILFCGPPGTGKTLTARVISSVMGYPFVYVKFDTIVSSFLGQTSTNLRKIFQYIEKEKFLVLFDEFDIVGKRRDDDQEHGEIKRVVNNFMQMLDMYNGQSILVAATNHQHLLDMALWRRFDDILLYGIPNNKQRLELFVKYLKPLRHDDRLDLKEFVRKTVGFSAADIAMVCQDALRKIILDNRKIVKRADLVWAVQEQKYRQSIVSKN